MRMGEESETERILRTYFTDLEAALASVPQPRREVLVSEIRAHVDDALADKPPSSPWDVREMLQRVGTPKEIAASAIYFLSLGSAPVGAPRPEEETAEEDPPPRKPVLGAKNLLGSGAFLLVVMGLSVGLLIAYAAPSNTPASVRTRIKVEKEAAATTTTWTTSTSLPTTTTTSRTVVTATTVPANVSSLTTTGTTVPATVPPSPSAPNTAMPTITIGAWTGVEPQTIWLSTDGGNVVTNIVWMSWGPNMGVGQGRWGSNNCVPDCAQGTVTQYSAIITVSNPSAGQFTQLSEQQTGPDPQTLVFTLPDKALNGASSGTVFDQ